MYILIKNQEGENMNLLSQNTDSNALLAAMKADIEAEYEKATGYAIDLDEDSGSDYLYDEQGQDELDWFACTSFAPRASGDESSHVVFSDMSFGNAFATTDVFVNPRKGIPFVQCSTENQLSDFRKADSHE